MKPKQPSQLNDKELQETAKKLKSAAILNAVLIGVMAGVILYSVVKGSVNFFTLVPVYFIYRLVKNAKHNNELKTELNERK